MIEVELRSFVTKEQYEKLLDFFSIEAKLLKDDNQETHYFAGESDLRIQKNNYFSKIWMKKGKIHDESREEIEIKFPMEDFGKLQDLFESLGYKVHIKWFRDRKQFDWNGIDVSLDYTKGYGHIIEMELLVKEENEKIEALQKLKDKFKHLGIDITPKEVFNEKFAYYKENWRSLV